MLRRRLMARGLLAAVLLAPACGLLGGSDDDVRSPAHTARDPSTPSRSVRGDFVYVGGGIEASVTFRGFHGRLRVRNSTGELLPRPGFYVLDARDGSRIDGAVPEGRPVPNGESSTFGIRMRRRIDPKNIGLAVLLFGGEDYGAFVPGRTRG
jgi:hypothetical protein